MLINLEKKEIKNAGWLIGGKIVQMIISFFIGIITARYLGPSNYGLINYGSAYVALFTSLCTLGLNSVIIKDFIDNKNEHGIAIGTALVLRIISSIMSVFMIIGITNILDYGETETIIVVVLCSVGSVFHTFETFNFWFQNQYQSKITSIAGVVAYIVTAIYKVVLLVLEKDVQWFAFATSVDYIIIAICLFIAYKKFNGPKLSFSWSKSKSLLRMSYHYILSTTMIAIYGQTDRLMLKQMVDQEQVGYYAIAIVICSMWTFVLQAIIDSIYPSILRLKTIDNKKYLAKNRQLYFIVFYVSCFVSLIFLCFGDIIVNILYGSDFASAAPILKVVTWYTAFSYLGVARNAWIVSERKQKYLKYIYGMAAIINVVLNYVLIPVLGGIGAALASLITQILTSIVLPMCIKDLRENAKLMMDAILLKGLV